MKISASAETVTGTISEFAAQWQTEYAETAGFLKLLKTKGIVKAAGQRSTGKGKPSLLFEVPFTIAINVAPEQVAAQTVVAGSFTEILGRAATQA